MTAQSKDRSRRWRRALLLAALVTTACLTTATLPAAASIIDMDAWPDGTRIWPEDGSQYAGDAVVVGGKIVTAGVASGLGGWDSSLLTTSPASPAATVTKSGLAAGDRTWDIALAPGGTAIYTAGAIASPEDDTLLIKWSKGGAFLWKRRVDVAPSAQDFAVDVATDRFGNVTALVSARGTYGYDWAVVSWTAAGVRRWVWRYGGAGHRDDTPVEILADRDGNYYVVGDAYVSTTIPSIVTVKLSPRGKKLWARTYAGGTGQGGYSKSMAACPTGGVYVGATCLRGSYSDAVVLRYSAKGGRKVFAPYPGSGTSACGLNDIAVLPGGQVVEVGTIRSTGMTDPFALAWTDQGAAAWAVTPWVTYWGDALLHVAADPFGGFVTAGYTRTGEDDRQITTWRVKPFSAGAQWQFNWPGPVIGDHTVSGLVVKNNLVAIAGSCDTAATGSDRFVQYWTY